MSASIGIVTNNNSIQHSSELLYQSVLAMQEAKRQGRNTWSWYEESNKGCQKRDYANLRLELMEAVKKKQFNLFYQPLIQPLTGKVKGVEALIRWYHPQRGYIPRCFYPFSRKNRTNCSHWSMGIRKSMYRYF